MKVDTFGTDLTYVVAVSLAQGSPFPTWSSESQLDNATVYFVDLVRLLIFEVDGNDVQELLESHRSCKNKTLKKLILSILTIK